MKTCRKCGALFDSRNCGVCARKYRAAYPEKAHAATGKWRAANPEKTRAMSAKYRVAHPERARAAEAKWRRENPEKVKEHFVKWRRENPEKERARKEKWKVANPDYSKQWRATNPEKSKANHVKWARANPDARRIGGQNRRATKRANGGRLSSGLTEMLFKMQRGKCACCGLSLGESYHLDHIMPLFLGGANEDWNMQLLKDKCNLQKHAKHPVDFMQSRGFLL